MGSLLDTSIAILLRDGEERAVDRYAALPEPPALSIIGRIELENGVVRIPSLAVKRRIALNALLRDLPVLAFDAACADAYRTIVEAVGYSRRRVIDRMIAATALVHDAKLITANGADFRDVPGLRLEEW